MIFCHDWSQSNNQWQHSGSPHPKKFRVQTSTGKFLASIFWYQDGILLIDYLPESQTINAEYYSSLLVQLKVTLKEKRRGKVTKVILFLHENAPAHRALATQKTLCFLGFQFLDHLRYSPDLAPSDYHLFPGTINTVESLTFFIRRGGFAAAETCLDGQFSEIFLKPCKS
jgi:histone-lysine N-methyltransferase SETMAR